MLNIATAGTEDQTPLRNLCVDGTISEITESTRFYKDFNALLFLSLWLNEETKVLMEDMNNTEAKSKSFLLDSSVVSVMDGSLLSGDETTTSCDVPYSSIILSAHICLLLQYLIECMNVQCSCILLLPKSSFWLPIRVLKAFITLQGKTGLCAVDSVQDSIMALRAFEKYEIRFAARSNSESKTSGESPLSLFR